MSWSIFMLNEELLKAIEGQYLVIKGYQDRNDELFKENETLRNDFNHMKDLIHSLEDDITRMQLIIVEKLNNSLREYQQWENSTNEKRKEKQLLIREAEIMLLIVKNKHLEQIREMQNNETCLTEDQKKKVEDLL